MFNQIIPPKIEWKMVIQLYSPVCHLKDWYRLYKGENHYAFTSKRSQIKYNSNSLEGKNNVQIEFSACQQEGWGGFILMVHYPLFHVAITIYSSRTAIARQVMKIARWPQGRVSHPSEQEEIAVALPYSPWRGLLALPLGFQTEDRLRSYIPWSDWVTSF